MLKEQIVEVGVSGTSLRWYKDRGYNILTTRVQLYCILKGNRVKNGVKERVKLGTRIKVHVKDLPPSSNEIIKLVCTECKNEYKTTWNYYKRKVTTRCGVCSKKTIKGTGSHAYWVKTLILDNDNAKCDISGETDKRFLVLHHLLSKGNGGINEKSNYVILSANYHLAFHSSVGGTSKPCTHKDYYNFKNKELY